MSAVFQEFKKSASGTIDKARLVFTREQSGLSEGSEQQEAQAVDRLEELAEYCPQLTFQQVCVYGVNVGVVNQQRLISRL